MLLLFEGSVFLCSPIIFSIVKPEPLGDLTEDFAIDVVEDDTRLDDKSSLLEEVRYEENGDLNELLIIGGDIDEGPKGDLVGDIPMGDFALVEDVFIAKVVEGNPTEHGGGGGLIEKFAN